MVYTIIFQHCNGLRLYIHLFELTDTVVYFRKRRTIKTGPRAVYVPQDKKCYTHCLRDAMV